MKRHPAFQFRRAHTAMTFILPAIVHDDGRWVFYFWRWALVVKYTPRWVRRALQAMEAARASFAMTLCPRCRLHDGLVGCINTGNDPRTTLHCRRCDVYFDQKEFLDG
jgi:hypothetical protein